MSLSFSSIRRLKPDHVSKIMSFSSIPDSHVCCRSRNGLCAFCASRSPTMLFSLVMRTNHEGNVRIFLLPPSAPIPLFLSDSSLSFLFYPVITSCRCKRVFTFSANGRTKFSIEEASCWLLSILAIQTSLSEQLETVFAHYCCRLSRPRTSKTIVV